MKLVNSSLIILSIIFIVLSMFSLKNLSLDIIRITLASMILGFLIGKIIIVKRYKNNK